MNKNQKSQSLKSPGPPGLSTINKNSTPDQEGQNSNGNYSGGLDLIKWLYDFVINKEPIAGKFLIFYKRKLDIWINNPVIFRIFLVPSLAIDVFFAFLMQLTIFALLFIIILSLARGLGIFDWLPEILKQLKILE